MNGTEISILMTMETFRIQSKMISSYEDPENKISLKNIHWGVSDFMAH